jgi:hypothetical protein
MVGSMGETASRGSRVVEMLARVGAVGMGVLAGELIYTKMRISINFTKIWRLEGSIPWPRACEARALPLS